MIPALASRHRVYAPDLPGFGDSSKQPAERSPAYFEKFVGSFLDAIKVKRAALAGNSLGGHVALRFSLSHPKRVSSLCLVDSAGLGTSINLAMRHLTLPGHGEFALYWSRTPQGALMRAWGRSLVLFAGPTRAPSEWLHEQCRLAQLPGFMEAALTALRAQISLVGQREVLLDRLPRLEMPVLIVWGVRDQIVPPQQALDAAARIQRVSLELIPDCGHLPQVECPELFGSVLNAFLERSGERLQPAA